MKIWLIIAVLIASLNAEEGVKQVVFDLMTGNLATFEKKVIKGIVAHKTHYEGNLEELKVAVVIHAEAYRFFLKDLSASPYKDDKALLQVHDMLAKRIAAISETYDVEFLMCDVGRKTKNITLENVYPFVKMVTNSTVGLIDKQSEGYAYIPVQ
jgi:intracellular sulfur oxidation DsrE/DsrF family protein